MEDITKEIEKEDIPDEAYSSDGKEFKLNMIKQPSGGKQSSITSLRIRKELSTK